MTKTSAAATPAATPKKTTVVKSTTGLLDGKVLGAPTLLVMGGVILIVISIVFFFSNGKRSKEKEKDQDLTTLTTLLTQQTSQPAYVDPSNIFPKSGTIVCTKDSPGRAWINPGVTPVNPNWPAVYVYARDTTQRWYDTAGRFQEPDGSHLDDWHSFQEGPYYVYPLDREKIIFDWGHSRNARIKR